MEQKRKNFILKWSHQLEIGDASISFFQKEEKVESGK